MTQSKNVSETGCLDLYVTPPFCFRTLCCQPLSLRWVLLFLLELGPLAEAAPCPGSLSPPQGPGRGDWGSASLRIKKSWEWGGCLTPQLP